MKTRDEFLDSIMEKSKAAEVRKKKNVRRWVTSVAALCTCLVIIIGTGDSLKTFYERSTDQLDNGPEATFSVGQQNLDDEVSEQDSFADSDLTGESPESSVKEEPSSTDKSLQNGSSVGKGSTTGTFEKDATFKPNSIDGSYDENSAAESISGSGLDNHANKTDNETNPDGESYFFIPAGVEIKDAKSGIEREYTKEDELYKVMDWLYGIDDMQRITADEYNESISTGEITESEVSYIVLYASVIEDGTRVYEEKFYVIGEVEEYER